MRKLAALPFLLLLAACASTAPREAPEAAAPRAAAVAAHDNLDAVAWMQTATEAHALSRQAFRTAERSVDDAIEHLALLESLNPEPESPPNALISNTYRAAAERQTRWNALVPSERTQDDPHEPLAVVVDVDETVLDNSPYQARLIRDGRAGFDDGSWSAWVQERRAKPLPGALEFARSMDAKGVTMFYVTNRSAADREATVDNLRAAGFPLPQDGATVMVIDESRGWTSDKAIRRREIDRTHRVVAMIGDNLGDFLGGATVENAQRAALVGPYAEWWGERWFVLPNPAYGSWESAITRWCADPAVKDDPNACKRTHLRYD